MKHNDYTPLNIRERRSSRVSFWSSILFLAAAFLALRFMDYQLVKQPQIQEQNELEAKEEGSLIPVEEKAQVSKATVIAVGDNLYHNSLIDFGKRYSGEWNYEGLYEHVADEVRAADIAIADQETVLTRDHSKVAAYPTFWSPAEAADALVSTGFDVIYSATNHTDDHGLEGIQETLDFWKTDHPEITLLGIHDSQEDADTVKIREVNGIRIAFLEYTYGTNMADTAGIPEYMIDMFSDGHERVAEMIRKAKAEADCLIFIAHWGTEDETMPTEYEKQWANFLMKQGVDVVIGGHPHVAQPYGRMMDEEGHNMVIFYSLGNFVSCMNLLQDVVEGMGCFTIQKTVSGDEVSIEILNPTVKPMVMHYDYSLQDLGVYMLDDYTEEQAAVHGSAQYEGEGVVSLKNMYRKFREIMSMNVEPSTDTDLMDVFFNWDGSLIDPDGNVVEDNRSISEYGYYGKRLINVSDYTSDEEIDYTADYSQG